MSFIAFSGGGFMRFTLAVVVLLSANITHAQTSTASSRSQAHWMLERLTGVKWGADSPIIDQMAQALSAGDRKGAAELATSQPQFLNVVVRQMALKMSTREETMREPFNDFAASFVGVTRDNRDARELLHGNFYYAADPARLNGTTIRSDMMGDLIGSNNHYNDLGRSNLDLGQVLRRVDGQMIAGVTTVTVVGTSGQTTSTQITQPVTNPDPAGVLTSRAFIGAHATAGTNRRLVEYTFRQFMCMPIQGWADTLASDVRIGRDIDRMPGGDSNKFLTTCKGCHTVMDGFRGAFAKYDWRDGVQDVGSVILHIDNGATGGGLRPNVVNATAGVTSGVVFKMNRNDFVQYPGGFISTDDSFVNNANRGMNASNFGWRNPAPDTSALSGRTGGVHAFGRLIAGSQRFPKCMAQRVWAEVCHTEYSDGEMEAIYASLGLEFENALNYNLRSLFEAVALHQKCRR
jgi:hypothetical protein